MHNSVVPLYKGLTQKEKSRRFDTTCGIECSTFKGFRWDDLKKKLLLSPLEITREQPMEQKNSFDFIKPLPKAPIMRDSSVQTHLAMRDSSSQTLPAIEMVVRVQPLFDAIDDEPERKKTKQEKELPFKCSVQGCNRGYDSKKSLQQHERDHNADFFCPKCPASFTRKRRLDDHVEKCNGLKK